MINLIFLKDRLETVLTRGYLYFIFYFYFYSNSKIRKKIKRILRLKKKGLNGNMQEEQTLPGMSKYINNGWYRCMIGRYLFSLKYIKGSRVLDSGCGLGWGSFLILDYAEKLTSIDLDEESIIFCKKEWKKENIDFKQASVLNIKNKDSIFDVILGYELIEHLSFANGKKYITNMSSLLKNGGHLILSSYFPSLEKDAKISQKRNKFHLHIYTKKEIKLILKRAGFRKVKLYGDLLLVARK